MTTNETGSRLCQACESDLPLNLNHCRICSQPLKQAQTPVELQASQKALAPQVCGHCQKHPPDFDRSFIPLVYQAPVVHFIHQFKFNGRLIYGKALAELFIQQLKHQPTAHTHKRALPQALLPVPLHPARIRHRGFNQANWLAEQISRATGLPTDRNVLKRVINTSAQHELAEKQRLSNLNHAFAVRRAMEYRHVAVIDDVVTTGTTANQIARLLKQHGVATVEIWALAKTRNPKR